MGERPSGAALLLASVILSGALAVAELTQGPASAQDVNPEISNCLPIMDEATAIQRDICSSHAGCRLVFATHRVCRNGRDFLGRLSSALSGRTRTTNEDVFEAAAPPLTASERLSGYVQSAKRRVLSVFGTDNSAAADRIMHEGIYFEGEFENANLNGAGVAIYPNGDMSRGEFRDGKLSGTGQSVAHDGAISAGQFRDNALSGEGATQSEAGEVVAGTFDNGHPIGMTEVTYPDGSTQRVLYSDTGDVLARGARAPPGELAVNPEAPPAQLAASPPPAPAMDIGPYAARCATERAAAVRAIYGEDPTAEQGAQLDAGIANAGIASGDAGSLRQTLQDAALAPNTGGDAQRLGEAYENCIYRARLRELDPHGIIPGAEPSIFASLPRRGSTAGSAMVADSLNAGARNARQAQLGIDRREARNQMWRALIQGAATGVQLYAAQQQAEANAAYQSQQMAAAQAQQSAAAQAQRQQQASQQQQQPPPPTPSAPQHVHNPANVANNCVPIEDRRGSNYFVNHCPFSVSLLYPGGQHDLAPGGYGAVMVQGSFSYLACKRNSATGTGIYYRSRTQAICEGPG